MSFMLAVEMERYILLHLTLKVLLLIIMGCISLVLFLTTGFHFFFVFILKSIELLMMSYHLMLVLQTCIIVLIVIISLIAYIFCKLE